MQEPPKGKLPGHSYNDPANALKFIQSFLDGVQDGTLRRHKIPEGLDDQVTAARNAIAESAKFEDPDIYMYVTKTVMKKLIKACQESQATPSKQTPEGKFIDELQIKHLKIMTSTERANHEYTRERYDTAISKVKAKAKRFKEIKAATSPIRVRDVTTQLFTSVVRGTHKYKYKYHSQEKTWLGRKKWARDDMPPALLKKVREAQKTLAIENSQDSQVYMPIVQGTIKDVINSAGEYSDHPMIKDLEKIQDIIQNYTLPNLGQSGIKETTEDVVEDKQRNLSNEELVDADLAELREFLANIDTSSSPRESMGSSTAPFQAARKTAKGAEKSVLNTCLEALKGEIAYQKKNPTEHTPLDQEFDRLVKHAETLKDVKTVDDFSEAMNEHVNHADNLSEYPKLAGHDGKKVIDSAADVAKDAIQAQSSGYQNI